MKSLKKSTILFFSLFFLIIANTYGLTNEEAIQARKDIVSYAKQFIGVPYVTGGITSSGMDCSGFLYTVARESINVQLPRTVAAMYNDMSIVPVSQLEPGDALFFNTVGNKISHVGLYIGNNQFLHAVSDGSNTGVIISSLTQTLWHDEFVAVGQFLPATNNSSAENALADKFSQSTTFIQKLSFDGFLSMLWNCTTTDEFIFNLRGADIETHLTYNGLHNSSIVPGFGIRYRIDPKMNIVQIPFFLSATIHETLRIYAGPVITFGDPILIGNEKSIKASFFPGILGIEWQSPSWSVGSFKMCFAQDFAWTVFNDTDNSALTPYESFCAGLTFSTGFRVTIPASTFFK